MGSGTASKALGRNLASSCLLVLYIISCLETTVTLLCWKTLEFIPLISLHFDICFDISPIRCPSADLQQAFIPPGMLELASELAY